MAKKIRDGWIAPFPPGQEFRFIDFTGDEQVERYATGIWIDRNHTGGVRMNYAGCDAAQIHFDLPKDATCLREVAKALNGFAKDIEAKIPQPR